ncbi:MAG: carboxypeptidase regulatory-like domain-containing protein [Clostridiales bacterium]|nr:carboxypeptidase regulatory-like domain-containing protein [Clostridiales bacterium]MCI1962341.1 carboxypeptidase regulatory-like domain-containing protein [Clostridiales bacterium]MCI2022847.1 carboxypeptidase regulatory-like domain-containing protein [Clostridiales bacterium]MCI2027244.1 carboxypeptidase regulatory-like domain-containing protein [Clostridiales bacterium]MCI2161964.1 carboxypeptidase regulatory-like domain-containing protein [Oscillospiraceae bacterium]
MQLTLSTASTAGVLTGTVTSGGEPLPGATLKVFDTNNIPFAHTITGPLGQYTIASVSAGSYRVTATKTGYLTPDVVSVSILANRPSTLNIALSPDPDATLNTLFGKVNQSAPLEPIENAIVNIYSVSEDVRTLVSTTTTNSSGQYLAPYLADGDYIAIANKEGYFQTESAIQTLTNAEITPLNLFLIPNPETNTGTISGLITSQTTLLPIANATVALYQIVGTTETIVQITKTNSGGRYLFGNVAEGQYVIKSFAQINVV